MTQYHYTSIANAAYQLVHKSNVETLAKLLGKTPNTLRNEVNLNIAGAKLGLFDAVKISASTKDVSLIQACCQQLGYIAIPLNNFDIKTESILADWAMWQSAVGATCKTIKEALEDNKITPRELADIQAAGLIKTSNFLSLLSSLEALAKEEELVNA